MIDTTRYTLQALQAVTRAQEITANNLANINTPGFRADQIYFHSMLAAAGRNDAHHADPGQVITRESGRIEQTGNPLDVAIQGDGFFQIRSGDTYYLTRNGRFQLNQDGVLVDPFGGFVQGVGGDISIQAVSGDDSTQSGTNLVISSDGIVYRNGKPEDTIKVLNIDDYRQLNRESNSWFSVKDEAVLTEVASPNLFQGGFETSNVDSLKEMVGMMKHAQMFESLQRTFVTADEVMARSISSLGRF